MIHPFTGPCPGNPAARAAAQKDVLDLVLSRVKKG